MTEMAFDFKDEAQAFVRLHERIMAHDPMAFHFEEEALFKEITLIRDYLKYGFKDIPPADRKPIKRFPLFSIECPYSKEKLEAFRTMKQPSDEWMEARENFLTASRFSHIAGDQPARFGQPIDYWREITGRVLAKPFGPEQMTYVDHGRHFEPIARGFYEKHFKVSVVEEGLRIIPEPPWIYSASPDGLIENDPQNRGIIEIKCNALHMPRDYVPPQYVAQMMGQMKTYKAPFCDFVNYWAHKDYPERFFFCTRLMYSEPYWKALKLRLDYMAWCIATDNAPTGMGELVITHPLPDIIDTPMAYEVSTAAVDDLLK